MSFECYRIGDLVLDAGTQEVTRNRSAVPVPRLSFRLLLSLARHAPNVVSTNTLEEEVWSGLVVDKGTINKRVLLLRKSLGEGQGKKPYITVIRGSGYRLDVPVVRIGSERGKSETRPAGRRNWYQLSSGIIRTVSYGLLGIVAVLALYRGFQGASHEDIVAGIAASLKSTMDENERPDFRTDMTDDFEAFTLYLKGRELLHDRIRLRADGLKEAVGFFWQAIELDPKFARAHAGVATAFWLLTAYDPSLDQAAYFERAEASAKFAIEIDPESTDALGVLASIHAARGEIEQAAVLFKHIRSIGSNDSNIVHWQAMLHMRLGYFQELIDELTQTYNRDPLNQHIGWSLAAALSFSGRPEEAAEILRTLDDFKYRDYSLGLAAIYTGDYVRARKLLRDVQLRSGVLPAVYADMIVDALEDPNGSTQWAQAIVAAARQGKLNELVSFEALLILGSPLAFDLGIDPVNGFSEMQMLALVWNNWGVALRQDPRFKVWVEKLGYVDFWRKHGWPDRCRPTSLSDFECV